MHEIGLLGSGKIFEEASGRGFGVRRRRGGTAVPPGIVRCLCQTSCQSGAVSAVGCCRVRLTVEVLCSCRVLSELSGVAVRRCRSCQSCQAAAAVRRWAVAVRCCQVVLSGCCQALTHTSHTYDTIKRRPAGLCCTYSSLYSASGPTIFFMVDVTIFLSAALRE